MKFESLKHRVQRAEQVVEGRIAQVTEQRERFKLEWQSAWTPGRIVIAGLATGFLTGRARPARMLKALSAARWVQLATSITGLFSSLQTAWAAQSAGGAVASVATAGAGADVATGAGAAAAREDGLPQAAPGHTMSDGRRRPDPAWDHEPRPAEAATEISER